MINFPGEAGNALHNQAMPKAILFALGSLERAEGHRRSVDWFNDECFRVTPRVDQLQLREVLKGLVAQEFVVFHSDAFTLTDAGEAYLDDARKAWPELQEPSRPMND
ncbi:hypothetical protein WG901_22685 [Novosphingobium sp. PS1R-30]|uniref:Uncharacterized protein n=1 Tax=Novosphingobium anseongense TaxID=3133436 RepID=A0ABU8S2M1_9SPHN